MPLCSSCKSICTVSASRYANKTVNVNAVFIREANMLVTLTSPVVSVGNSKHSGKLLRNSVMQNYRSHQRSLIEYCMTKGGVTNKHL